MIESQNNELTNIFDDKYNGLTDEEKIQIHELFKDQKTLEDLKEKIEKIIFIRKPPTPEEFLDPAYKFLPEVYIDGLYDYVKRDFIEAMRTNNPYSIISIYGSTRTGKSILALLFAIYSIVYISYLRDPHTYFKINRMSRLCGYLVSFKAEKTKEVYLAPILNLLDNSDMFIRERFEQNVYKNKVDDEGRIHFSEATKFGNITFPKFFIVTGKDASSLVGSSICFGTISELTFFKQYVPGLSDEEVVQVFTKLFTRIQNTVGFGSFPSWAYIDSSANNSDSPIEKMILGDLRHKENTFYRHYILWEVRPHLYPKYHKTGETFTVCTGNGSIPAKVIENQIELKDVPQDLIVHPPIDLYDTFKRNLLDSIRDIAGRPTGAESKFIQQASFINNIFDNPVLKNIICNLKCDANDRPEQLIWNQLSEQFFKKSFDGKYYFYRAPKEARMVGLDLGFAITGDATGLCMLHKEWSKVHKEVIYVIDFCFGIVAREKSVNLEAISQFVYDIQSLGNTYIRSCFVDTFQSENAKQNLERRNISVIKQSVDRELTPYQYMLTCMANGLIKAGQNIYLKNNLYCLQIVKNDNGKEKIDHPKGTVIHDYNGDWETSQVGINAKDISDAVCQALWGAKNIDYIPSCCYEDENDRLIGKSETQQNSIKDAVKQFHEFF